MKTLIKNVLAAYLLIFSVFFTIHSIDDKNPMIHQEESMLEAPVSGAILDNERKKLEKAINDTEKVIKDATIAINDARHRLNNQEITQAELAVVIGEQNYKKEQAQIKLAEITAQAFDKVQSSPEELGYMDRLRAGIGGVYEWMRGYTQIQKEIAQSVIKQINEQMKQAKENYDRGIKFITDPQERDRITEDYNKVISDLALELKHQKLITGEEMSTKEKLFLTTATIAGGLITAAVVAKLGQKGYEYLINLPAVDSSVGSHSVGSTSIPLTEVKTELPKTNATGGPIQPTGEISKTSFMEAKPEIKDIKSEQEEVGLWETIQKAGSDFLGALKSLVVKTAEEEDKEPGLPAEKVYESGARIVGLGQQAKEKAEEKIGEFFAPEKMTTNVTPTEPGMIPTETTASETDATEGEPGILATAQDKAGKLATDVQKYVSDLAGQAGDKIKEWRTGLQTSTEVKTEGGETTSTDQSEQPKVEETSQAPVIATREETNPTQSGASSREETPKPELTNLEKNKLLMSINTWKSKLSWLPSEKTLLEKIENAQIQPEKDKLMNTLNERRRIQRQLNEATEKLKP